MFLKYDGEELVGICGVYVDDFIIAGSQHSKKWQAEKTNFGNCTNGVNGNLERSRSVEFDTYRNMTIQ